MSSLPKGWVISKIDLLCGKPEQIKPEASLKFNYIDISSVDRESKMISEPSEILGSDAPSRARKIVNTGDVLVSMTRPNLNAVAKVPEQYNGQIASTGFDVLKPFLIQSDWLFSIVKSKPFIDSISGTTIGALYPACKASDIRGYEMPVPPLAEQKRIVEKLGEVLAQVDTIKARLDGIPSLLKRFRQSVLASAVSGKLTEEWRGEDKPFSKKEVLFETLISSSSVGLVRAAAVQYDAIDGGYAYLKMNNIDNFWGHNIDNLKFVDASPEEVSKYRVKKNDWLFNTRNSSELVGKSCVWKGGEGFLYNNNILRVRFNNLVVSDYVEIFMKSPKGQQLLNAIKSGTTNVAAVYQKQLFGLVIELPLIEEQKEIVRLVEQYFAFADTIEAQVKKAQARVNNLTQSILAKAFRGELVSQDPNDEPANKLLERIAQARIEAETLAKAAKKAETARKKAQKAAAKG
ncbi:restriction endonuclease subunit S [Aliivibrio fischeri]|uniref:restriction endonuclease subunit S n=1 Tax=Aliivibrio fischeri TaxID=668 RepID=UPI0009080091|nr:restriction endonuclease subunit S [Aliivibrio fischeri]